MPELALLPALRAIVPIAVAVTVSESATELTLSYPSGLRTLAIRRYPDAGHMITMRQPAAFAADLSAWLSANAP